MGTSEHRATLEAKTNLVWNEGEKRFNIAIPKEANIAADTVARHAKSANAQRTALVFEREDGTVARWTFAEVDQLATNLAASLRRRGIGRGDRIAIHTGLRPETGIAHMAAYKLGAVVVTLSQLYGPDTVRHVLNHAESRAIITQDKAWNQFRAIKDEFSSLEQIVVLGTPHQGEEDFDALSTEEPGAFTPESTTAEEPALLMYTSGSTGMPKGLLHGHRVLHAYSPTVNLFYDLELDDPELVFWTPADWAWVGGLLDLLLPAWEHGQTVVTSEHRFDAEWAYGFMQRHNVTHTFMAPTALKRLAEIPKPRSRWPLALRVVCTGGESLPGETFKWIQSNLGVTCNEFYGLTEVNHLVGNCQRLWDARTGSMGRAYPGHGTALVDADGGEVADGEVGQIVARSDDPTRFLGYWKNPELTEQMQLDQWLCTGDLAVRDNEGYFWYRGRADDLIKTAGYRVGPAEVENALLKHPAVAEAAVVPSPDAARGNIVKAFVRLRQGFNGDESLVEELKKTVKHDLAAYKYPREIQFVDSFTLTSSGKIDRKSLARTELERKAGSGNA